MEALLQNQGHLYSFSKDSFTQYESKARTAKKNNAKKEIILTLIADDHPYLISGVEADLNKDTKIKIAGTVNSYDELIEKAFELQPDVILLDLRMPGRDKHDLKHYIQEIKTKVRCKVIIFSSETGWARIHRCLDIGASAYVEKAISIGRLAEFIHRVYEQDELLIFTAEDLPQIFFSVRQTEVLHYLAEGKENEEISKLLKLDVKTIQSYVAEVKEKLSNAFGIYPIKPRTLLLLASKLGFGSKVI